MSLIFQSLQKLKSNLDDLSSGSDGFMSQQNQEPAKPIFKLKTTLIGLVVVLALGCGTVYAVQVLKQRVGGQAGPVTPGRRHAIPPHEAPIHELDTELQHDDNSLQATPLPVTQGAQDVQTRFYPPAQKRSSVETPTEAHILGQDPQSPTASEMIRLTASGSPLVSAPLPMTSKHKPVLMAEPHVSDAAMEAAERARRAALEKSARIARLVREIEQAVAGAPNGGNPQTLLDQLAGIKGKTHPYIMKMRAYWNFKRGQYSVAEADLKKVIAVHPDDLEAGINLALIEIHDQRYREAMARLKRLRHTYPDQPLVADLIKRLK